MTATQATLVNFLLKKPNFVCQYFVVLTQDAFMIRIRMFTVQSQELWIWLGLRICIHRYWSCNASPWTKLTHNRPSKISWVINADDSMPIEALGKYVRHVYLKIGLIIILCLEYCCKLSQGLVIGIWNVENYDFLWNELFSFCIHYWACQ